MKMAMAFRVPWRKARVASLMLYAPRGECGKAFPPLCTPTNAASLVVFVFICHKHKKIGRRHLLVPLVVHPYSRVIVTEYVVVFCPGPHVHGTQLVEQRAWYIPSAIESP